VAQSPHGTVFHRWEWLRLAEQQTASTLYPFIVKKTDEIKALYPFFVKRKPVTMALSPAPRSLLLYLGPVIPGYETMKQSKKERTFSDVQETVDTYLYGDLRCKFVRIRTAPGLEDSRPMRWAGYDPDTLYTYRINLSEGPDAIWKRFDRKLRVDINRAIREGVSVSEGDEDDLDYILTSLTRRYKEQGIENPSDYSTYIYSLCHDAVPDNFRIFIAKYRNERVGGMIAPHSDRVLYVWTGIPKSVLKGISPNDLVQWEAIKWACSQGMSWYEIMDAGANERLRFFKAKYNPELRIWYSNAKYSSEFYRFGEKCGRIVRGR
jgi:hypothetical protein